MRIVRVAMSFMVAIELVVEVVRLWTFARVGERSYYFGVLTVLDSYVWIAVLV
jgi:hypothetical protein